MAAAIGVNVVASGFGQLLLSQLSTRLISFLLNLVIARHLSPEAYGLSSIQFHLITTTILLLSREGLRRGCLRFRPESNKDASVDPRHALSVAWLAFPIGLAVTAGVTGFALFMAQDTAGPAYRTGVILHGVAALIELAAEPLYILALVNLEFKLRARVDTLSLLVKSGLTLLLVTQTAWEPALVFGVTQICSSLAILTLYAAAMGAGALQSLTKRGAAGGKGQLWGPREREVLRMSGLFSLQAVEKQLLAEGSKMVLVAVQGQYDQGVYGLVSNLGSLVVRTLFQPLEDIAFAAFSRFQVIINESQQQQQQQQQAAEHRGDKKAGSEEVAQLAQVLTVLVRAVTLLGLLSAAFGPAYAYTLVRLVYSTRWSETAAPAVLAVYSQYILLLAVNGVTEAFVHAVLDAKGLQQMNLLLIAFSVAHVTASIVCIKALGAVGLVVADALNMALRIACSAWYIRRQFASLPRFSLLSLLPRPATLGALGAASAACLASQHLFLPKIRAAASLGTFLKAATPHVGVGITCLAAVGLALLKFERRLLADARATLRGAPAWQAGAAAVGEGQGEGQAGEGQEGERRSGEDGQGQLGGGSAKGQRLKKA